MRATGPIVALAGLGVSAPAFAAPGASSPELAGKDDAAAVTVVTLLTGDRVYSSEQGISRVVPAQGRAGIRFSERRYKDHHYVIPLDAMPAVTAGRLDPQLFDITGLRAQGYTDDKRHDLPVIVRGALPRDLAGVKAKRSLAAVDGTSLTVAKGDQTLWRTVLKTGEQKVWLDRRLKLNLSGITSSTPGTEPIDQNQQIGAPAAWRAGYTGAGVRVAVLDSGVDDTHPDLAGRIVSQRNFTDEPGGDKAGHGTFVASEIASVDPKYRGVAPDAKLSIAKVCTTDGRCLESAAIAAMNWAATEQHAKVVNMSFGEPDKPGLDPLEEAVNNLTAEHGTLVVSGAGNFGAPQTIASPASADAALAVGAVFHDDDIASFSSQGPRPGDFALKPDMTAPGVGVVGALAKGSVLDDGLGKAHVTGAGTSLSAPLAAGAATLLFQQHPTWTPAQIKSALIGSAEPRPGVKTFVQSAGRADLSEAIKHDVLATTPPIGFGLASWPHDDDTPIARTLTYQNTSDHDVTLRLQVSATGPDGEPTDRFHLSASTLTLPAHGTGTVSVTADTRGEGPDGGYTGNVLATSATATIRTPVAVVREVESHEVTIKGVGRDGQPAKHFNVDATPYDETSDYTARGTGYHAESVNGTVRLRLPRAHYVLTGTITESPDPESGPSDTLIAPWLTPLADQALTLDAREAKRMPITVQRDGAKQVAGLLGVMMHVGDGYLMSAVRAPDFASTGIGQVGPDAPAGKFVTSQQAIFAAPGKNGDFADSPYVYNLAWFSHDKISLSPHHTRDSELARARTTLLAQGGGTAGFDGAGGNPSAAQWTPGALFPVLPVSLPTTREELYTTDGVAWSHAVVQGNPPPASPSANQVELWREYRAGRTYSEVRNGSGVFGPSLPGPAARLAEPGQPAQFPDGMEFRLPLFAASSSAIGNSAIDAAHTRIYANGKLACEHLLTRCVIIDKPQPGKYRVEMSVRRSLSDMSTSLNAVWTFTNNGTIAPLPVQVVRFAPELDQANSAPGGRTFTVPVSVQRNPGAPTAATESLAVDVSYDDGKTWNKAPVHQGKALLKHPKQGYVSLRAKAVDSSGGSVEQTIIHAYRLH